MASMMEREHANNNAGAQIWRSPGQIHRPDIRRPPRETPIRILVCVWWLSTIVVVNIYLGILFGQLVIPRRPKSIESLEELVGQQQVPWCVTQGTGIYELFERASPDSVYGQLGRQMRNVSSADEGVARVARDGWAFIRERSILDFKHQVALEHNKLRACRMQLARERFFSVGFGMALRRGSRFLAPFNSALSLLIENGFVARWQSMYWPSQNQFTDCKPQPLREGDSLGMKHFISIYLVCTLILAAALLVLTYQWIQRLSQLIACLFRKIFSSNKGRATGSAPAGSSSEEGRFRASISTINSA